MKRRDFTKYLGISGLTSLFAPRLLTKNNEVIAESSEAYSKFETEREITKPISTHFDFFNSADLNKRVIKWMNDPKLLAKLPFINKTCIINGNEGDLILGKAGFKGKIFFADVRDDGTEMNAYEEGSYEFTSVPNIKIGQRLSESILTTINDLKQGRTKHDSDFFEGYKHRLAQNLANGLLQRMNQMIGLAYLGDINRGGLGIKFVGKWDMPDELQLESDFSEPISDIKILVRRGKKYKKDYDHMMLSSKAFVDLVMSREFVKEAGIQFSKSKALTQKEIINLVADEKTGKIIDKIKDLTGLKTIEIYDGSYWEISSLGAKVRSRVIPENKIILSSSKDQNSKALDFVSCTVFESVIGSLFYDKFADATHGPLSYFNANKDLNPPEAVAYAVMKGFPRRTDPAVSAVITIKDSDKDLFVYKDGQVLKG